MDVTEHLPDRDVLREYWPLFVGLAVIVFGNVYYYGVLGREWQPFGPALLVAIAVVAVLELGRAVYRRV